MKIKIKFNKDYRKKFKENEEIIIPVKFGITYLTGSNGSGKSTILRAIRASKDSLEDYYRDIRDGIVNRRITDIQKDINDNILEIDTSDFSHIFCIDEEADNPTDFMNAATAYGLISGGGHQSLRQSRGESTAIQFHRFIKEFESIANIELKKENLEDFEPLVIIDEIDEGLDIRLQVKFNQILFNKFVLSGAHVLVVSHNPICMLSDTSLCQVYDIEEKKLSTPEEYIARMTGKKIIIEDIKKS